MVIKPHIVAMMKETLPAFSLISCPRSAYIFRRSVPGEPFDFVEFQRDSFSGALAVALATTYDAGWCGESGPLGRHEGLADLRYRWHFWVVLPDGALPATLHWYQYGPSQELFQKRLREISRHLQRYAPPFFKRSRAALLADPLLQFALAEMRRMGPLTDEDRHQLTLDLEEAGYLLPGLTNQHFLRFREMLEQYPAQIKAREDARTWIPRLAYDLLALYPDRYPSITPGT
jgi:hypothetical protein